MPVRGRFDPIRDRGEGVQHDVRSMIRRNETEIKIGKDPERLGNVWKERPFRLPTAAVRIEGTGGGIGAGHG